jgi:phosphoglucosamine mutase
VARAVTAAERALGAAGRVLLRTSGTEPVIRVMVEGRQRAKVSACAKRIAAAVRDNA